jgi:hypothetical protein
MSIRRIEILMNRGQVLFKGKESSSKIETLNLIIFQKKYQMGKLLKTNCSKILKMSQKKLRVEVKDLQIRS